MESGIRGGFGEYEWNSYTEVKTVGMSEGTGRVNTFDVQRPGLKHCCGISPNSDFSIVLYCIVSET